MREKAPKMRPPTPPDPPKPFFFWLGGMSSNLPRPKKTITLHYIPNLRCTVPISDFRGVFRQNVRFWALSGARSKNLFYSLF